MTATLVSFKKGLDSICAKFSAFGALILFEKHKSKQLYVVCSNFDDFLASQKAATMLPLRKTTRVRVRDYDSTASQRLRHCRERKTAMMPGVKDGNDAACERLERC